MSGTGYTAGPWEVFGGGFCSRPSVYAPRSGSIASLTTREYPSRMSPMPRDMKRALADAHLIAAAPDMYEAICELVATKEMHDQLEALKPLPQGSEEEYRRRRVAAWIAARAAIAKAKGEQP